MKIIAITEHQNLYHDDEFKKLSDEQKSDIKEQKQNSELFQKNGYSAEKKEPIVGAFHIGIDWLIENELALIVNPKIEGLDYLKMFMTCFNHAEVSHEINKNRDKKPIYNIDLDKKAIDLKTPRFEITPLIIIHFVKVLEKIVKRGLKQDYIRREENLSSKIKGKIMFSKHLKKNVMMDRKDRVFCNYQDYSVDCLENQVLKKALVFCKNYLSKNLKGDKKTTLKTIDQTVRFCQSAFGQVSDIKQVSQLKQFKVNKLYRDYDEALKLAKIILKRFGYNFQESQKEETKIPPFWIDMALLFEMYVLAKLKDQYKEQILYQSKGASGIPDFLKKGEEGEEKVIIDAKYKKYSNKEIDDSDICQLLGYARNEKILKKLGIENTIVDCLIIYPKKDGIKDFESDQLLKEPKKESIKQFIKFYKMGMKLPNLPAHS